MINANTITKMAKAKKRRLELRREAKEKAESAEAQARYNEAVRGGTESLKKQAEENILKAANRGEFSATVGYYNWKEESFENAKKFLEENGYKVKIDSHYQQADSGDPESGEGRCDAAWMYQLQISWKA